MTNGYFGIGVYHPKHHVNIGGLWRHAHLYGASFIFTIGRRYKRCAADTSHASQHIPLYNYLNFDSFRQHLPYGCPIVAVEQTIGAIALPLFIHPKQAVYLLGAEDHGLPGDILDQCHSHVEIPTPIEWSMNVSHAGTVLMYDRYVKGE